jgi:hypothetical protein
MHDQGPMLWFLKIDQTGQKLAILIQITAMYVLRQICMYIKVSWVNFTDERQGPMLWSQFFAIFDNFRRKNWRFFSKTNVMIQFLHNLALFWVKNDNFFAKFFRRKYLKNHNIGPSLVRKKFGKIVGVNSDYSNGPS